METIKELYKLFTLHPQVITDSRQCKPDSLFFALKGDNFDGNQFAQQAIDQGCNYAIVDDISLSGKKNMFVVNDVLTAMQQLAHYHRQQLAIPIIGITGTNGKTTTKELTHAVLNKRYKTFATKGNLNNHIGVPLTLLAMDRTTEIGIVEMGANHIGEIKVLCDIADPDFGIITNIGHAHLEGFGSYEGVKKTKSELYNHISAKSGSLFVNADDEVLMKLSSKTKRFLYSIEAASNNISGLQIKVDPFLSFTLRDNTEHEEIHVSTTIIGKYNIYNALAAACVGNHFGINLTSVADALSQYQPTNNRSQFLETATNKVVMDAYNANPSSMKVAIENFDAIAHQKKVVILGGMKELGSVSEEEHNKLFEQIQEKEFSQIVLIGEEFMPHQHDTKVLWFPNSDELTRYIQHKPFKDCMILVKGSRSNRLEVIQPYL